MFLDPTEGIILFTDGSSYYKDGSGGWAWLALDVYGSEVNGSGYESDTTNNRMEMQAWIEGLKYLTNAYGACEVLVYSDSQYVGLGAMEPQRSRKKNKAHWKALDEAIDVHDYVEFCWVKGHNDSRYNKAVDKMAGEARKRGK